MRIRRILYWVWLAVGFATFIYGLNQGGGPAGWLLAWEVARFGRLWDAETHLLLSIPLVFAPIAVLAHDADLHRKRRLNPEQMAGRLAWIFGGIGVGLALAAGMVYGHSRSFPQPGAPPVRIALDEISASGSVPERRSVLMGTPQRRYSVAYSVVIIHRLLPATEYSHLLIPMTRSTWTPAEPVRFLVDTHGLPTDGTTKPGLLLKGQVPIYIRTVFRERGVLLADDVMLHSTDRDAGRKNWYVAAGLSAIGALLSLTLACGFWLGLGNMR